MKAIRRTHSIKWKEPASQGTNNLLDFLTMLTSNKLQPSRSLKNTSTYVGNWACRKYGAYRAVAFCECGMPFPCGLTIVARLLVRPPPDSAFHWNSIIRRLNQSVNSNWRGSPGIFFVFCSFFILKWHIM